ncbi:calmodulin [Chrysochromulina tobinii]|uniref:Calmodulin n=1 Tax=Chrysochromulina tobinii TaxID=1460289 RepID=A0A0M0K8W0_9EUKA|nr:calmodulin [Chrysochromulina tobinii]|eukprot:KOO35296.1 calmodulin [Chrysochromulina sp. CCMP291]
MRGLPLRNVAEHLFAQHIVLRNHLRYASASAAAASKSEIRCAGRRLGMRGGAARHPTMQFINLPEPPTLPEIKEAEVRREAAERTDPVTIRAREAAKQAFAKYDKDLSGAIDSAELFACLMAMGEVPGVSLIEQQRYLSVEFAKADADGSGSVDYDEFVTFYVKVVRAQEAERAARAAFARFDTIGDHKIEKSELFQVLVDLGMATGDTKEEKERSLEEEFAKADADKSGYVDFDEFIAFYTMMRKRLWGAELQHKKRVLKAKGEQRRARSQTYVHDEPIFEMLRLGDVKLLSARWWLQHSGYERYEKADRTGRKLSVWTPKRDALLLPCRQLLEAESPEAYVSVEALELLQSGFLTTLRLTRGAEKNGVGALPIVVASHCWASVGVADPHGVTQQALAGELARHMGAYEAWGYDDMGIFFDWSSIYQDTVDVPERSPTQAESAERALSQMALLYAHKQTTVYVELSTKVFTREADRDKVLADYRRTLEIGFGGVERLAFARRGWADEELEELALVLKEVDCPHVRELDLSANDITAEGLKVIGALHALEILRLSDCSWLQSLPESLIELHMLHTIKLDGCIGLSALPATFANMASLRTLDVTHCLRLLNLNGDALKMLPSAVNVITERKEKTDKLSKSTPDS